MIIKRLFKSKISILMIAVLIALPSSFSWAAEKDKVIQITVSGHSPAIKPAAMALADWAKWIEQQSNGRVKMNVHLGGSLMKGNEAFRGVQTGVVDVAQYVLDGKDGFLLNQVIELPFMGWPSQLATTEIYEELIKKFPDMTKEWKSVKLMVSVMMAPTHIHTAKKPVRTPADLKGLKIQTSETMPTQTIIALGGTPVNIKVEDMYLSFDRGLIDGVLNHFFALDSWGVLQIPKYHTVFGEGGISMVPMTVIMNEKKFNSLPPDIQKIFVDARTHWLDRFNEYEFKDQQPKVMANVRKMNQNFINLDPKQVEEWQKFVKKPIHDKWMKDCEAKGMPAKAVYDETLKLIKKYQGK